MSNAVLPLLKGLTFPVRKTPRWSTKIQTGVSGKETRIGLWSYPIYDYEQQYSMLRSDNVNLELQTLLDFYSARQGSFDTWLFNDPDDNTATLMSFGTGDGATTAFQLTRTLIGGGFAEPVSAPNTVTQVRVAGSATGAYTLNSATGVITFTVAPANAAALDWTGTYYWRCRFKGDTFDVEKFHNMFWEAKALKFVSVK